MWLHDQLSSSVVDDVISVAMVADVANILFLDVASVAALLMLPVLLFLPMLLASVAVGPVYSLLLLQLLLFDADADDVATARLAALFFPRTIPINPTLRAANDHHTLQSSARARLEPNKKWAYLSTQVLLRVPFNKLQHCINNKFIFLSETNCYHFSPDWRS